MKKAKVISSVIIALFLVLGIVCTVLAFVEADKTGEPAPTEAYGVIEIVFYYGLAVLAVAVGLPLLKKFSSSNNVDSAEALLSGCNDVLTKLKVASEDKKLTKSKLIKVSIAVTILAERANTLYCENGVAYYATAADGLTSADKMLEGDDLQTNIVNARSCIEQVANEMKLSIERENLINSANGG